MQLTPKQAKRFSRFVSPEPNSGCWLWSGATVQNGYGVFHMTPKSHVVAHRISYQLHIGAIPPGMEIDHICFTRGCVNPDHLEAVSHQENDRRKHVRLQGPDFEKVCKRGHVRGPHNSYYQSGYPACRECALARARQQYIKKKLQQVGVETQPLMRANANGTEMQKQARPKTRADLGSQQQGMVGRRHGRKARREQPGFPARRDVHGRLDSGASVPSSDGRHQPSKALNYPAGLAAFLASRDKPARPFSWIHQSGLQFEGGPQTYSSIRSTPEYLQAYDEWIEAYFLRERDCTVSFRDWLFTQGRRVYECDGVRTVEAIDAPY